MRRCAYAACATPDVPLEGAPQRKYHAVCGKLAHNRRVLVKNRARGVPARPGFALGYGEGFEASEEDVAMIEKQFQSALAEIRRRPRPEPSLGYSSPLARIF